MIKISPRYYDPEKKQVPFSTFTNWFNAYNLTQEDQKTMKVDLDKWQKLLNDSNQTYIIYITKAPHEGTWYPPGFRHYFDFELVWPDSTSREYHALLQKNYSQNESNCIVAIK